MFNKAWELYKEQVHIQPVIRPQQLEKDDTEDDTIDIHTLTTLPYGGDGIPKSNLPPELSSAMKATKLVSIEPGETIVKELIHHSLLDIETGMVMRDRQILRAGMVVTSLAARLYRGRTDIFQRHIESYTGPLMAFIMDMSGSMRSTWPGALAVMGAVAHTLNRAGASTICLGFSSDLCNHLYQFQDVDETFDIDRFHGFDPPSGNADAVAVEYCRRQLLSMEQPSREPKKKYIIVFSDEQPCGMVYKTAGGLSIGGNDGATLNQALDLCKMSGVTTISIRWRGKRRGPGLRYDTRMHIDNPEITLNRIMEKMGVL